MGEKRLVSIVIPTLGRQRLLKRALHSVIQQTYTHWEAVVAGNSTQGQVRDIVASFADPRIRYVDASSCKGPAAARNVGIKRARGELVAFLDDDDWWLPLKLELQVERFISSQEPLGIVFCGHVRVDETGRILRLVHPEESEKLLWRLLHENYIPPSTAVVRRDALEAIGLFDERLYGAEDRDLWIRLAKEHPIVALDESLVVLSVHQSNISKEAQRMARGHELLLKKHYSLFADYGVLAHEYVTLGKIYSRDAVSFQKAKECVRQGLREQWAWSGFFLLLLMNLGWGLFTFFRALYRSWHSLMSKRAARRELDNDLKHLIGGDQ